MSDSLIFEPLSLSDIFEIQDLAVYELGADAVLTAPDRAGERALHLFENKFGGRIMFGLNLGPVVQGLGSSIFVGSPSAVEIRYAADGKNWDFGALTITANDGTSIRIDRNDTSFPEPTFRIAEGLRSYGDRCNNP